VLDGTDIGGIWLAQLEERVVKVSDMGRSIVLEAGNIPAHSLELVDKWSKELLQHLLAMPVAVDGATTSGTALVDDRILRLFPFLNKFTDLNFSLSLSNFDPSPSMNKELYHSAGGSLC
jgi:hypothetical protein